MATTKSRKLRRLHLRERHEEITTFLNAYTRDPSTALKCAFEKFGRQRFEQILQRYLVRHSINFALSSAMTRCSEDKNV
jgi:hypothetical protein